MQNVPRINPKRPSAISRTTGENGLLSLAEHFQSPFDPGERSNHDSVRDYLAARRKFVQYLMQNRSVERVEYRSRGKSPKKIDVKEENL